jgi:rhodanese-related sulfurtransferase
MVLHLQAMEGEIAVSRIYPEDLISMLDRPDVVILDFRSSPSWDQSTTKIRGAIRIGATDTWISEYPKYRTYVLYCS